MGIQNLIFSLQGFNQICFWKILILILQLIIQQEPCLVATQLSIRSLRF